MGNSQLLTHSVSPPSSADLDGVTHIAISLDLV